MWPGLLFIARLMYNSAGAMHGLCCYLSGYSSGGTRFSFYIKASDSQFLYNTKYEGEFTMGASFLITNILLGVGLAMDAFSVSMANGLQEPRMRKGRMSRMAGVYAAFQFAMPMIGWICVHTISQKFQAFEKFIPWIALILLAYIGGKMLIEGIRNKDGAVEAPKLGGKELFLQGVATSIDALSVGFTIADYGLLMAILACLLIAGVTFVICFTGIMIGKKFGTKLSNKASILGGVILLAIGIEIFVKGVF